MFLPGVKAGVGVAVVKARNTNISNNTKMLNTYQSRITRRGSGSSTGFLSQNNKYQICLCVLNVIILIAAVIMVFVGYNLIIVYHFDKVYYPNSKLDVMWPFHALPWSLIGLGIATMTAVIFGFFTCALEFRPILIAYSVTLAALVLGKFYLIYITV